jgi:hypothetical protein
VPDGEASQSAATPNLSESVDDEQSQEDDSRQDEEEVGSAIDVRPPDDARPEEGPSPEFHMDMPYPDPLEFDVPEAPGEET